MLSEFIKNLVQKVCVEGEGKVRGDDDKKGKVRGGEKKVRGNINRKLIKKSFFYIYGEK